MTPKLNFPNRSITLSQTKNKQVYKKQRPFPLTLHINLKACSHGAHHEHDRCVIAFRQLSLCLMRHGAAARHDAVCKGIIFVIVLFACNQWTLLSLSFVDYSGNT